ncbi:hypothetical protein ES703_55489 [subsurface metagenome]
MNSTIEGEEVMLAHGIEGDILNQDQLIVLYGSKGENLLGVLSNPREYLAIELCHSLGSIY